MNAQPVDKITIDSSLVYALIEVLNGNDANQDSVLDRLTTVAEAQGLAVWFARNQNPLWTTL